MTCEKRIMPCGWDGFFATKKRRTIQRGATEPYVPNESKGAKDQ